MKVRWRGTRERERATERKNKQRKLRNELVKIQQRRLSCRVRKHVRYVLEEDTKDDAWSSSFGPDHSSGPASNLFKPPVPAAAPGAPEVSQQLRAQCMCKRLHAGMSVHTVSADFTTVHSKCLEIDGKVQCLYN